MKRRSLSVAGRLDAPPRGQLRRDRRVRLRAIVVPTGPENTFLTLPHCMWHGKVWVDHNTGPDFSGVGAVTIKATERSTATRWYAAQAEFEGTVRLPSPDFPMLQIEKIDHVGLVEIPVVERPVR